MVPAAAMYFSNQVVLPWRNKVQQAVEKQRLTV